MTTISTYEPLAIIGVGCRFPGGGNTPGTYWHVLTSGEHTSIEVPADRWDLKEFYDPDPNAPGKSYTPYGCFVENTKNFDAQFFEISPREAASLDPQQRLLLEVTWEAIENANLTPAQLAGRHTGVFIGISSFDYSQMMINTTKVEDTTAYYGTGNSHSTAAGRLSYFLKLTGPNMAVDTACSSSLVALHLAARSLQQRECDAALAGGVNLQLSPMLSIAFSKARMLAQDGRCKVFDQAADGYVRGEGSGMVLVKRLDDALADGDHILAVIRGSAVNHDGSTSGLTVPSPKAQEAVIRDALQAAGLNPADISYVEAHGTGTAVGDPVEAAALASVFGPGRAADNPLYISSAKTTIGHLEAASGMAGLIKALLALQHGEIPPHLHFEQLNPLIDWDGMPFEIPTSRQHWQPKGSRVVSINNFGFSGTNAHIILEEFTPVSEQAASDSAIERPLHLLTLSAKSEGALRSLVASYADYLTGSSHRLSDISFTANTSRTHFDERLALAAATAEEAAKKLTKFTAGERTSSVQEGRVSRKSQIAFLFNGQGPQHIGMGRELYETAPRFRQTFDYCADFLADYLDVPLHELLYPANPGPEAQRTLTQTIYAQPAMFVLEYALADLWRSWGIVPDVVVGHSIGEYAAACVAGVFSLEDGLRLLALRGPSMQALPSNGGMLAVMARPEIVDEMIAPYAGDVSIAAYNSPANVVVSGVKDVLYEIAALLEKREIQAQMLEVSHAFHSHLMDPALGAMTDLFDGVEMHDPRIPMVSSVDGQLITAETMTADYWVKQARQAVHFSEAVETLHDMGCNVLVELGPQPSLLSMARRTIPADAARETAFLPSLREKKSNWQTMLNGLMTLYLRGEEVNWQGFDAPYARHKVTLPTYPFERSHYWFGGETKVQKGGHHYTPTTHPLLGESLPVAGDTVHIFQQRIGTPGLFGDHRVFDIPVMPATGYLEIALAAGRETFKCQAVALSSVRFEQMLNLSDTPILLQVIVTRQPGGEGASFEIFSRPDDEQTPWLRYASGGVAPLEDVETLPPVDFEAVAGSPSFNEQDASLFYRRLNYRGLTYGPAFRGITGLWAGEKSALGWVTLPQEQAEPAFVLHPALSDAALHPLAEAGEGLMLPVSVDRLAVWGDLSDRLWSRVESDPTGEGQRANVYLFNAAGEHCASLEGLQAAPLDRGRLLRLLRGDVRQWAYKPAWKAQPLPGGEINLQGAPWLIFGSEDEAASSLMTWITEQGGRCVLAAPGDGFQPLAADRCSLNPASPEDFIQLLSTQDAWQGVVFLWGAESGEPDDLASLREVQKLTCGGALHLVQAMASLPRPPRLWLVTRGAQPVDETDIPRLAQAPLWGVGRTVMLEEPELACACLDLDPVGDADNLAALIDVLGTPAQENQIAYRGGQAYAARMTRYDQEPGQLVIPGESFQLKLAEYGLDNLYLSPTARREPGAGEVEIRVQAAGLNFRDTLTALGMLQDATAVYGIHEAGDVPLGGECCGVVTAVGEGVTHLQVNDEVLTGFALGSLGSFVITPADLVFHKPQGMTPQEAVTLPIAFLTAYYGLIRLANLQPGERVLIHAAAGGVGQAAVQLAQRVGAEIYATASPGKWDFLREQGIKHIMNSRTLDFGQQIRAMNGGQGVDVVLNGLTGDFVAASLDALGEKGRFIEMGKIGIFSDEEMQARRPDVSYAIFDLLEMAHDDPDLIREMFDDVHAMIQAGEIKPLPHRAFSIHSAGDAFRYMAQARHIGKVVITLRESDDTRQEKPRLVISSDATYLVTGGTGGLGLKVAEWLAAAGAGHLVLCSRSGKLSGEDAALLQSYGAQLHVMQADVADPEDVTALFASIQAEMPPLRGVIHAAGVLDIESLQNQQWTHFERAMQPKLAGGWNLHQATCTLALDFFVNFSSIVSLWGSPGQANYAAANAFLDALASYRRALGLPGLTLNWGAWAEVGMAARQEQTFYESAGLGMISPVMGLQALEWSLQQAELPQIALTPIDWAHFAMLGQPLFEDFSRVRRSEGGKLRETLLALPPEERHARLLEAIRGQLAQILALNSTDEVKPHHSLLDLGLDSLMGVELINHLEMELGQTIAPTAIFNYPTLDAFTDYLLTLVLADESAAENADGPSGITLDPAITPPDGAVVSASMQAAFITGGTGFVGAYLLAELLKTTQADLYCLVRGTADDAAGRLRANLEQYGLWQDGWQERLTAVPGNLTEARFGLTEEAFARLAEEVDAVYHVGAILNLVQPYEALKPTNVDGTQEVLRLAARTKLKPVHHVSTIGLFLTQTDNRQTVITEADFPDPGALRGGYVQTKWAAEQLILQAQERGIPAIIYRLGFIVGASDTGYTNKTDLISRIVKGAYQMRRIPDWDIAMNFVPVDYAGRAIAYLSQQPENQSKVFHVTAQKSTPVMAIVHWANELGYGFQTIPYEEWRKALLEQPDNALLPLLPMFAQQGLTYNVDRVFDCKNTLEELNGTGITPMPVEELFATYYDYLVESGFLAPPETD